MIFLAAIGVVLILGGLVIASQRIDDYYRDRRRIVIPALRPVPQSRRPFLYSETQCVDCGQDGELLDIKTHQCIVCFELIKAGV